MEKVKTLQIFDLDETFFRMPGYTSKKQCETADLKFDTPYSFYDHEASLDAEIHNIQLIEPVYLAWQRGISDESTQTVLITHRIEELKPAVHKIFSARGIKFDQEFFLGRKSKKIETLIALIAEYPDLEKIEIYEDSVEQIAQYLEFLQEYNFDRYINGESHVDYEIYMVDKSTFHKLEHVRISSTTRIKLI